MKEYIFQGGSYYSVKCDKCNSYMENKYSFGYVVTWVCPNCNHAVKLNDHRELK